MSNEDIDWIIIRQLSGFPMSMLDIVKMTPVRESKLGDAVAFSFVNCVTIAMINEIKPNLVDKYKYSLFANPKRNFTRELLGV